MKIKDVQIQVTDLLAESITILARINPENYEQTQANATQVEQKLALAIRILQKNIYKIVALSMLALIASSSTINPCFAQEQDCRTTCQTLLTGLVDCRTRCY